MICFGAYMAIIWNSSTKVNSTTRELITKLKISPSRSDTDD